MSQALANFLFEAANFLLLAAALGWLLFKPVRAALDAESQRRSKELDEIARLRAEAESLKQESRASRDAAARDTQEQRERVLEAARREAAGILEEARKARIAERQALEQEREIARAAEAAATAETMGRMAATSLAKLLEQLDGPSLDQALVRGACAELEGLPAAARRSAVVESARPLDAQSRGLLEAALGASFQERVVGELGAGVRVTTEAGQVAATAVSVAETAARAVSALGSKSSDEDAHVG